MPDYHDPGDRRYRYELLSASLRLDRSNFESHWRELADYFMPRRIRLSPGDRNRGDKRNQNIIDSTGRFALRTLSSGLHAGLTSPARPWMKLTTPDPDLAKREPVKSWLHDVSSRMLTVFATSNLYNVLPLVYMDMGLFGTAAMSIVEDSKDLFRCYSYPIGSWAIGMDERGLVTTFMRDYELTVRQVVREYGLQADGRTIDWSNISTVVKDLWDNSQYESPVPATWIVQPNEQHDSRNPIARYKKWASCHFETGARGGAKGRVADGQDKFLRESGFDTFPIMAPRWDITGEDSYGTDSPGMTALGDNKQLQMMQRDKGRLLKKAIDPPVAGPASLRNQKTSLLAGDITYVDARDGMQGLTPIHEVRLEGFQYVTADIGEVQYRIQRAFYEDLFLMLARSDDRLGAARPTAREIEERHEEKLLAIGPVLERTNDELLDPIVDRIYAMMDAAGLIPPAPEELEGIKLKVTYISILAEAQKLVGVVGQDRFVEKVVGIAQTSAEVLDKVDWNQVVDNYGDMLGVDPRIVRPTEDAAALVAEKQAAVQAQMESEQALNMAKAAKEASQAPLSGDSVLQRIVSGAQAQSAGGI